VTDDAQFCCVVLVMCSYIFQ